jgi:hypothetical protein
MSATKAQADSVDYACSHFDQALNELMAAMQDCDRRDHRLMVTMNQKYGIPQKLGAMAQAVGGIMAALKPILAAPPT